MQDQLQEFFKELEEFDDQNEVNACCYVYIKKVIEESEHPDAARTLINMISLLDGRSILAEVFTALAEVVIDELGELLLRPDQKVSQCTRIIGFSVIAKTTSNCSHVVANYNQKLASSKYWHVLEQRLYQLRTCYVFTSLQVKPKPKKIANPLVDGLGKRSLCNTEQSPTGHRIVILQTLVRQSARKFLMDSTPEKQRSSVR